MPTGTHDHNEDLHSARVPRNDAIYAFYYVEGWTMQEIANLYDLTRERVRQILNTYRPHAGRRKHQSSRSRRP
jgi:DNA-binding transcriptional regulator LsrR (DeoR family)